MKRSSKAKNVSAKVKECVLAQQVLDTRHSMSRGTERNVRYSDVLYVLKTGWHEAKKDEWKEEFKSWNYSIRGKTVDGIELRIPVFFEEDFVVIATVVKLEKNDE